MKIVKFCIMLFTAALFSLSAAEDVLACYTNAAWKVPSWSPFYAIDDFLGIRGYVMITSKRSFEIDSDAEYEISGTFRSPASQIKVRNFECGFIMIDEDGKQIPCSAYSNYSGSMTTLAADVKPGDKIIKIKKAPNWTGKFIAFNAREDLSDLPNRETYYYTKKVEEGGNYILTLRRNVTKAYKAGTSVRCHGQNKLWTLNRFKTAPKEWKTFSGRIKGIDKTAASVNKWYPGAGRACIFIIVPANAALEFKDIAVRKL